MPCRQCTTSARLERHPGMKAGGDPGCANIPRRQVGRATLPAETLETTKVPWPQHRPSSSRHPETEQRAHESALERIRTFDTRFRRAVLYPLSYKRVQRLVGAAGCSLAEVQHLTLAAPGNSGSCDSLAIPSGRGRLGRRGGLPLRRPSLRRRSQPPRRAPRLVRKGPPARGR